MNEQIEKHIEKYPGDIIGMFKTLRQLIYDGVADGPTETLWAGMPSYYSGSSFVRLIPFKDHINIEARAAILHRQELAGYKFTPKGMLQIYTKQSLPTDTLKQVFAETLIQCTPASEDVH